MIYCRMTHQQVVHFRLGIVMHTVATTPIRNVKMLSVWSVPQTDDYCQIKGFGISLYGQWYRVHSPCAMNTSVTYMYYQAIRHVSYYIRFNMQHQSKNVLLWTDHSQSRPTQHPESSKPILSCVYIVIPNPFLELKASFRTTNWDSTDDSPELCWTAFPVLHRPAVAAASW